MNTRIEKLTSTEKALKINLQPSIYGVFAEIGAGQEVSNHFYKAGAASGTIAKSIGAYDMMISDSIYGKTQRYVSKDRLENMLDVEYKSLISSVPSRAAITHFFAFANTIETTSYYKTNKGQGWVGLKFQTIPNGRPSSCYLHVIMHTDDILEQQKLIGDLGVNLIYGLYEFQEDPEQLIVSLKDNIDPAQLEINFIKVSGNNVAKSTGKELSLLLVKHDLTKMVMIGKEGQILQPLNALYKKDAVIVRGRFNPPTKVTVEMFERAKAQLMETHGKKKQDLLAIAEITFRCYQDKKELVLNDFLKRTEMLTELGYHVMVTNFKYHHEFIAFLNEFVKMSSLNLVLGLDNLELSIQSETDKQDEKEMLKLIQSLIAGNNRILAFPEISASGSLGGIDTINLSEGIRELLSFLVKTGRIEDIKYVDTAILKIRSNAVMDFLESGKKDWEPMVPKAILPILNSHQFTHNNSVSNRYEI
jgi:hypothetical protein